MGDAAACAISGQSTPTGYYNLERMLKSIHTKGGEIAVCGTCIDARGIKEEYLVEGASRGSMEILTSWTLEADKVIVF